MAHSKPQIIDKPLDLNSVELQDLLGLIIHSYNNHLTGIMGHTELAQLEECSAGHKLAFDQVLSSGYGAIQLGHDLLTVIGRSLLSLQSLPISQLLELLSEQLADEKLVLNLSQLDDFNIDTDKAYFVDVLTLLVRFIQVLFKEQSDQNTPSITIQTNKDHRLEILASEINLTTEQQASLFNPFYSSRMLTENKDVGLAKAKGFFKQTGASIEWINQRGFIIQF
ncbi:MAG: hypothetical protein Q9M92_17330 [Enterobacterales bacterium]|nr:hypothetical protein [Enterobacterales bacterium]